MGTFNSLSTFIEAENPLRSGSLSQGRPGQEVSSTCHRSSHTWLVQSRVKSAGAATKSNIKVETQALFSGLTLSVPQDKRKAPSGMTSQTSSLESISRPEAAKLKLFF